MKLLVDTCVAESVYKELVNAGYDAEWTGDWDDYPGDSEILRIAHIEGRILVTLDKHFGELAVLEEKIHCGIIRLGKLRIAEQAQRCIDALEDFRKELQQGAIVVVGPAQTRCRPASPRT
jgi:predicted nuclease of predicted toxin-antitoxin system